MKVPKQTLPPCTHRMSNRMSDIGIMRFCKSKTGCQPGCFLVPTRPQIVSLKDAQLRQKCPFFLPGMHLNYSDDGWCWPRRHLGCQGAGLSTNHIFKSGESTPKSRTRARHKSNCHFICLHAKLIYVLHVLSINIC